MADAASARRARLIYESLPRAGRPPTDLARDPLEQRATTTTGYQHLGPGREGEDTEPIMSAAERVRSVLRPGLPAAQIISAGARRVTKSGRTLLGTAATRGDEQNAKRLREANAIDRETLGESQNVVRPPEPDHLPGDASLFFSAPAAGPCDKFAPPSWFLEAIKEICLTPSKVPTQSPIRFEVSERASEHNAEVLRGVDFDLGRLIRGHDSSTLGFGSEFRTVSELRPLMGRHPHFTRLEKLLTEGMHYVFARELEPSERVNEVTQC